MPSVKHLVAALLTFPPLAMQAHAQTANLPDAGSILRQIQPVAPPLPAETDTGLRVTPTAVVKLPPGAPFLVTTIQIVGNKKIDTATLHALVADGEGKNLTLADLEQLAARLTAYYRSQGYPLARAVIPQQVVRSGIVTIQVILPRLGKVVLENRSESKDSLIDSTLQPLKADQEIHQTSLDHALLLLTDLPGVVLNAALRPGETNGTSDLLVNATLAKAVSAGATIDNYGNRYTGRERLSSSVAINNPLRLKLSDMLSVNVLSSGSGMNYGRLAYESVVSGQGTRVGAAVSILNYKLQGSLEPLLAHGTAQVATLWLRHPFIRQREGNLNGQVQYDHLVLNDHVDASALRTDRHLDTLSLTLSGDIRDTLMSNAISTASISQTVGQVTYDNATALQADAATANLQGNFSKWNVNLSRLQAFGSAGSLYLTLAGQWANRNLDSSQKMTVGGSNNVRAYDVGTVSGDTGLAGTIELREELGMLWSGQWQTLAFVDSARVSVNHSPWSAGINRVSLSGAGIGLNAIWPNQLRAKVTLAVPIGAAPALTASVPKSARAWMEIGSGF